MEAYRRHPMSLVQRLLVLLAALVTFGVLVALIVYILVMGVPNLRPSLFAWKYTSENASMLPAIINTPRHDRFNALDVGALRHRRGDLPCGICKPRKPACEAHPYDGGDAFRHSLNCVRLVWLPHVRRRAPHGQLYAGWRPDTRHYGASHDPAHDGGGAEGRAGFFPGGQLRPGAGRLRTVFRVVLPSAVPGIFQA